jgi:hypothetical protein
MLQPSTFGRRIGGDVDEASGLALAKPEAVQDTCETWRTHKGMTPTHRAPRLRLLKVAALGLIKA